jgi:hypothetical protein
MKNYFYKKIFSYISLYTLSTNSVLELEPKNDRLKKLFDSNFYKNGKLDEFEWIDSDFIVINGYLHNEADIQTYLEKLRSKIKTTSRLVVTYYSSLWKPLVKLATWFRLRDSEPEQNWIAHEDIKNFLLLSGFELVRNDQKILFPFYFPIISNFINRYIAPLPFFRHLTLVNVAVARPMGENRIEKPSVSVVVPTRNEEGNIQAILQRIPMMGPRDEIIFIEGNSTDNTWKKIQEEVALYKGPHEIQIGQQDGKGKGDAVRKGFGIAKKEILMILDADLTVPPEDLPKFYKAIVQGKGEYINGSRLVYPMEKRAMRFFNILGNKFFAMAFSFVLGQRFKDTLCGTKVLTRENYEKLARNRSYFGDFDPFGDFDLIFGAARMGLKIVEVPISYKERTYGDTNISRWKHGAILLAMLLFAARRIKFI